MDIYVRFVKMMMMMMMFMITMIIIIVNAICIIPVLVSIALNHQLPVSPALIMCVVTLMLQFRIKLKSCYKLVLVLVFS